MKKSNASWITFAATVVCTVASLLAVIMWAWYWHSHSCPDHAIVQAIAMVESGGDSTAMSAGEDAVGILQITPIMIDDVNRIVGYEKFTLDDRLSPIRSEEVFWIYTLHYSKDESREVVARRWNGGPHGERKTATKVYWKKVKKEIERGEEG